MALSNQLHRVRYFCSDAWDEWRHNLAVNLMALLTLVSALFLAGLIMLIVTNVGGHVETLRNEVKVEVYLHDGDEAEQLALAERLRGRERVERVEYVGKDEALRRYRDWAAELADLVGELETNPLPASFEIYLTPGNGTADAAGALASVLENEPGVEDVRVNLDWLRRLEDLLGLARVGGVGLVGVPGGRLRHGQRVAPGRLCAPARDRDHAARRGHTGLHPWSVPGGGCRARAGGFGPGARAGRGGPIVVGRELGPERRGPARSGGGPAAVSGAGLVPVAAGLPGQPGGILRLRPGGDVSLNPP
jgi:hypothetical protein